LKRSINILGHNYRIVSCPLDEKHGQFDTDKGEIHIDSKVPPNQLHTTFLHEVLHAALHTGGVSYAMSSDLEEAVVRCLEHALAPLVRFK